MGNEEIRDILYKIMYDKELMEPFCCIMDQYSSYKDCKYMMIRGDLMDVMRSVAEEVVREN